MIYGIGLPRTGTKSLAEALLKFKLEGAHFCLLEGTVSTTKSASEKETDFIVDNSFYNGYQEKFSVEPDAKFILTMRNKRDWLLSLSNYTPVEKLPDIDQYYEEVRQFFHEKGCLDNLLVLDIDDEAKWERLSDFLNKPIPEKLFPGDEKWRINAPVFPVIPSYDEKQQMNGAETYVHFLKDEKAEVIMTTAGTSQFNLLDKLEIFNMNCRCDDIFEGKKILGLKADSGIVEEIQFYNFRGFKDTALMFTYPERYYSDETIVEYFDGLADQSDYPVVIHCLPLRNGRGGTYCYTAVLINKLCKHENIIGIKEETPDLMQAYNVCRGINKSNCQIIVAGGSQRRFKLLSSAGAQSFLAGIGSIYPSEDILPSPSTRIDSTEDMLFDAFFKIGWHPCLRYALKKKGLISEYDRMPFYQLTEDEKREVDNVLEKIEEVICYGS